MTANRLLGEHANERQVAIPLVEVQTVADDKFVRDVKAHVIGFNRTGPVDFIAKQKAEFNAFGSTLRSEVLTNGMQGDAAVEDIVKKQDMAATGISELSLAKVQPAHAFGTVIA